MAQEVAVSTGARTVSVNLKSLNYTNAAASLGRSMNKLGVTGRTRMFPGEALRFNQGVWARGLDEKAVVITAEDHVVFNFANLAVGYRRLNDEGDKKFYKYSELALPFADQTIVDFESLEGHEDEIENQQGRMEPAWKNFAVVPVRLDADEAVDHVIIGTVSGVRAMGSFVSELVSEAQLRPGQLPVVSLGSKKVSREVEEPIKGKPGKTRKVKQSWDVPTFEVTGWVDAKEVDNGGEKGVAVTDDSAEPELGKVTASGRVPETKAAAPKAAAKATPAKATRKKA